MRWPALTALLLVATLPAAAQPAVQPFTVEVQLSPKAAARLAALRESISLAAVYYGDPMPAARRFADSMGQIPLGNEDVTIPGQPGSVTFTGSMVPLAKLALIRNHDVKVNLNVFSARRSGPDNILNCDLFEDSVALATRRPVRIKCKLIAEGS